MTTRVTRLVAAVLVTAVGVAGCSRNPQRYEDVSALAQAVSAAGVDCERIGPGWEAQLVVDSGTCADSGVMLYLFDSARDLESWQKVATRLGSAVIGPNWAATGNAGDLARISDELAGEFVDASE